MEQTATKLDKPPENVAGLWRLKSWMNMLHEQWKFSHLVKWHSLQKQRPRKVNTGLEDFSCRMAGTTAATFGVITCHICR